MNIRTATEADLDHISALADEIAAFHSDNEPEVFAEPNASRDREFWLSCITQPEATVTVATNDGTIVGFVTASYEHQRANFSEGASNLPHRNNRGFIARSTPRHWHRTHPLSRSLGEK